MTLKNPSKVLPRYVPSHIRRQKKRASDIEFENAELRRRLSKMKEALQRALRALNECSQRESLVSMAFRQVEQTIRHTALHPYTVSASDNARSVLAAEEAHIRPNCLYVPDRDYAKEAK